MGDKMVKKSFQIIGLILLIGFSFFYTEKVATVVRNQDPLMVQIIEHSSIFNKQGMDALIEGDSIIPGVSSCVVNVNASYSNMKRVGSYSSKMIEYKEIKPKLSLDKLYNRYIVRGNKDKHEIALVFKLSDSNNIVNIINMLSKRDIKASFFIDGKLIENESQNIYKLINQGHEIYNLGYENQYNKDLLLWTNTMIENISYNRSKYCLVTSPNDKVLDLCSSNKMYTIKPDIVIDTSSYFNDVKPHIVKGSIIVFDISNKSITEVPKALLFLNSKGYKYNLLSNHLSEKGCYIDK